MRIALAGLGNVGEAVVRLIRAHRDDYAAQGHAIDIVAVSARDKNKNRACDLSGVEWSDDPRELSARPDIDIVVEMIGGADGIAYELAVAALGSGKHFVTANKAMIAAHGVELARMAEERDLQLLFEAAVCAGIPVLKTIREGLAANRISRLRGILNGTCNYILTRMGEDDISFESALAEAQQRGYAEADPAADIDGHDSAAKLAILSATAFGAVPDMASISVTGIRNITLGDMKSAALNGGVIKLLGVAVHSKGKIVQTVKPTVVFREDRLLTIGGVTNAVEVTGDFAGEIMLQGPGAGGNATASAIVADLIDIARGHRHFAFGIPARQLAATA